MNDALRSIDEARAHLKECLTSEKFLGGQGLGSQLPIFIAAINPREDLKSAELSRWLVQQSALMGTEVTRFDLFEELASSLEAQGILEVLLAREESSLLAGSKLTQAIRAAAGLEELVENKLQEVRSNINARAVLITGLGSVFPFFRISDIVGLLESVQIGVPAIVLFPGEFASSLRSPELRLFSKIPEFYNYRAIDIFSYEP
jgi:hypothetical protein